jgi:hypothetical protein
LKNRFAIPLLVVGILILIITPLATLAYGKDGRVLYRLSTEINSEGGSVLGFTLDNWTPSHTLEVYLSLPIVYNTTVNPLFLDIIMVDNSNMTLIENNQSPNYLFFHAYGIGNTTSFFVKNINQSGQYDLVIYNVIPVNTTADVNIIEEWYGWNVNPLIYPMMAIGSIITVVGIIISFYVWRKEHHTTKHIENK